MHNISFCFSLIFGELKSKLSLKMSTQQSKTSLPPQQIERWDSCCVQDMCVWGESVEGRYGDGIRSIPKWADGERVVPDQAVKKLPQGGEWLSARRLAALNRSVDRTLHPFSDVSVPHLVPLLGPVRCLAMGNGHVAHCCELTVASCAETVDAGGPCVVTSV